MSYMVVRVSDETSSLSRLIISQDGTAVGSVVASGITEVEEEVDSAVVDAAAEEAAVVDAAAVDAAAVDAAAVDAAVVDAAEVDAAVDPVEDGDGTEVTIYKDK